MDPLETALRFTLTPGLGRTRQRKLLNRYGAPAAALEASAADWGETLEEGARAHGLWRRSHSREVSNRLAQVRKRSAELGVSMLALGDDAYPAQLRVIPDPPPVLYCLGEAPGDDDRRAAIVGTRKATSAGLAFAHRIAGELSRAGVVIVSGLALGIDSEAHRATIEMEGKAIAVLANGLETVHPHSHTRLARSILSGGGCLLSENPPDTSVQPWHFISRNRIIAGLSRTVLIVEAGLRSGAMRTAEFALDQGRTVMVMPGRPGDPAVAGCLQLLRDGAVPATCADDVLSELGVEEVRRGDRSSDDLGLGGAAELLDGSAASFEAILAASGRSPANLLVLLGRLELQGLVRRNADGNYFRAG